MEAKSQLDTSYSFQVFKFKTYDNLIGSEPNGWQCQPKIAYFCSFYGYLLFHRTLGMQDHIKLKWHDNTVISIDV